MKRIILTWALFALCSCASENKASTFNAEDPEYDGSIFFRNEDQDEIEKLSPEEQKRRLAVIVKKIDTDLDGFLTEGEISLWIQQVYRRYAVEDVAEKFLEFDKDGDGAVSWNEYTLLVHDRIIDMDEDKVLENSEEKSLHFLHLKEKQRFDHANTDGKPGLNVTELLAFLHPSEVDHMFKYAIEDVLNEYDRDNDGFISLHEFLGDLRSPDGVNQSQWEIEEKLRFVNLYDRDNDGKLNYEEQLLWVAPNSYGTAREEALHLIQEMDRNGDGRLSEMEIMSNMQTFMDSEVTDYGRQLHSVHDEL
ncbi:RCN2 protein, partial [Atractosteus spatula]|nr:RCN2 protein [Atractosteus spatula]